MEKKQVFELILDRVHETARDHSQDDAQAFARWFVELFYAQPSNVVVSDGPKDGKVDLSCTTHEDEEVKHHVVNAKFTSKYNKLAPNDFYTEITRFRNAFENKPARKAFLKDVIRPELRTRYANLLERYDAGAADLVFVTNHARNDAQYKSVEAPRLTILHLEDLIQFTIDHIEDAMPKTPTLLLSAIGQVLSPEPNETVVPTSIVFAKVKDFIDDMKKDPFDLFFARNVRLWLGNTSPNEDIRDTFENAPKEFVFSNNGITLLCESHHHDPGPRELRITNPRVVNGSQTLHSVRHVEGPSDVARVMVRIIEIPPVDPNEVAEATERRREIIRKISTRMNQQNPIRKWNLVANDEFQYTLARYFRKKALFYERRAKEWSARKGELTSVGVQRGPKIKELAQLIASYHWENKSLGPVTAKRTVDGLFEDRKVRRYSVITQTKPELAYQLFVLSQSIERAIAAQGRTKKFRWFTEYRRHGNLAVLALVVKHLYAAGGRIGTQSFARVLEADTNWSDLITPCLELIRKEFDDDAAAYRSREGKDLTKNNYFKSSAFVDAWLKKKPRPAIVSVARNLLAT